MYEKFYGFKSKPFHIAPNPDFLFMSKIHQDAITCLEFGIMEDTGFVVLTGDIGTGKTTLIQHILKNLDGTIEVAVIYNTNVNANKLLNLILREFGFKVQIENKADVIQAIKKYMKIIRSHNKRPLLIIDEAQNLTPDALEEVRLLSNIQDDDTMLLQIMLVGQPELRAKLKNKAAASFAQRVAVSYHLVPLSLEETRHYIIHRLETAGGRADLFTDSAIHLIYKTTMGVPRSINLLSHNALVYGFADDIKTIDTGVLEQVIAENNSIGFGVGSFDRKESETNTHSDQTDLQKKQQQLEGKIKALERHVEGYTNEIKDMLQKLITEERKKNDQLLKDYIRLEASYNALKKNIPIKHSRRRSGIRINLINP